MKNKIKQYLDKFNKILEKFDIDSLELVINRFLHVRENNKFVNFQFLSSWSNHYKSWIDNKHFPIKIVKYE